MESYPRGKTYSQIKEMKTGHSEFRTKGRSLWVPSVQIGNRTIIRQGRFLKVASILDEEWQPACTDPDGEPLVVQVRHSPLNADIFKFAQSFANPLPRHPYPFEWDNVAAVATDSASRWWDMLPQESRKNVRRAQRMGVTAAEVEFSDRFVSGITEIYNADPVRQSSRFWHYGKGFDVVKLENSTYLDRSCFIGAFLAGELIGFAKLVYVDKVAKLMQIVARIDHRDKRPTNLLLAKAVEVCAAQKKDFLIYGKYTYGNKTVSSLTEFKRRNGFKKMPYPTYFAPLTLRGRLGIRLRLHRGLIEIMPGNVIGSLIRARRRMHERLARIPFVYKRPGGSLVNATAETISED